MITYQPQCCGAQYIHLTSFHLEKNSVLESGNTPSYACISRRSQCSTNTYYCMYNHLKMAYTSVVCSKIITPDIKYIRRSEFFPRSNDVIALVKQLDLGYL